jgi:hypothetical protein
MKSCNTIRELRKEFGAVKSGCAGDTIFMAKALMFLCERKAEPRKKRKPSEWQKFLKAGMRKGKSVKQLGEEWRAAHSR